MSYVSTLKLMSSVLSRKLDPTKLLKTVDRTKIINELRNTKEGIPKHFRSTNEAIEEKHFSKILYSDKIILQDICEDIKKSRKEFSYILKRLTLLKKKYPNVPMIYNYIGLLYEKNGDDSKHYKISKDTINKFPDYIFGKISLCDYYINKNMHSKVPDVFKNKLNIYQHYPENKSLFHVSEVRGFYSVLGSYYVNSNKLANAYYCYFILCDIDPEHEIAKKLASEIILKEVQEIKNKFDK